MLTESAIFAALVVAASAPLCQDSLGTASLVSQDLSTQPQQILTIYSVALLAATFALAACFL